LTATISASTVIVAAADEFEGFSCVVDQLDITDVANPGLGDDVIVSDAVTPSSNGSLVYGAVVARQADAVVNEGTAFTAGTENTAGVESEFLVQAMAAAVTADFDNTGDGTDDFAVFIMTLEEEGAGGGSSIAPISRRRR
jgi:hypothetical protein